ncbi:MAG: Gfo/Idh/MocA family oxidoreductase [Planctomycetia bacterium]|nr:Gfo/Idh/MocA family oxidoreductase [Planctomycetia bacterium]
MHRRRFLQSTTAAGLTLAALRSHAAYFHQAKPKRVGLIGCGWYGKCDLLRLIQVEPVDVVSICDVDSIMGKEAAALVAERQKSGKEPLLYGDYLKMLAEQELDICLVGTPDHWHALAMIEAVKAGCDVYQQKPISVDVIEGQSMVAAARKYKKVVQVGTQRRSTAHLVEARDRVIREGLLGNVAQVEVCCYYHMRANENPPDSAPPANLDYEMWTGPAPLRPFNKLTHPRSWRAFMEYGNGIMGDMCVHMYDTARWMLDIGWPTRISSAGGILVQKESRANITDTQTATFDHGDKVVNWTHRSWGDAPDPEYPWAVVFYGDKGTLKASVEKYEFKPHGDGNTLTGKAVVDMDKYPEDRTERDLEPLAAAANRAHQRDFLAAIASRTKSVADIEQGHISSASCILANLSMQLGRTLTWDAEKHQVVGDEEANKLLRRPYRAPWVHPEPDTV